MDERRNVVACIAVASRSPRHRRSPSLHPHSSPRSNLKLCRPFSPCRNVCTEYPGSRVVLPGEEGIVWWGRRGLFVVVVGLIVVGLINVGREKEQRDSMYKGMNALGTYQDTTRPKERGNSSASEQFV